MSGRSSVLSDPTPHIPAADDALDSRTYRRRPAIAHPAATAALTKVAIWSLTSNC